MVHACLAAGRMPAWTCPIPAANCIPSPRLPASLLLPFRTARLAPPCPPPPQAAGPLPLHAHCGCLGSGGCCGGGWRARHAVHRGQPAIPPPPRHSRPHHSGGSSREPGLFRALRWNSACTERRRTHACSPLQRRCCARPRRCLHLAAAAVPFSQHPAFTVGRPAWLATRGVQHTAELRCNTTQPGCWQANPNVA